MDLRKLLLDLDEQMEKENIEIDEGLEKLLGL